MDWRDRLLGPEGKAVLRAGVNNHLHALIEGQRYALRVDWQIIRYGRKRWPISYECQMMLSLTPALVTGIDAYSEEDVLTIHLAGTATFTYPLSFWTLPRYLRDGRGQRGLIVYSLVEYLQHADEARVPVGLPPLISTEPRLWSKEVLKMLVDGMKEDDG